ncbi:hypothetical protein, partial [Bradyrhizobium sp. 142]
MLETYFSAAKMLGHLRSGPSGPYLDGFAAAQDFDLAAFGEHLRTCRCPRAKGGRRNHHTIYGARL